MCLQNVISRKTSALNTTRSVTGRSRTSLMSFSEFWQFFVQCRVLLTKQFPTEMSVSLTRPGLNPLKMRTTSVSTSRLLRLRCCYPWWRRVENEATGRQQLGVIGCPSASDQQWPVTTRTYLNLSIRAVPKVGHEIVSCCYPFCSSTLYIKHLLARIK